MRYATLCSGIEAPSMGWHGLGWKPVFFSEIEPFPKAVLKHHYPNVPDYGDMTKYKEWKHEPIDLICAGTPCQSFSVAGLRKGIEDPRGNLTLTFLGVLERYRPTWVVWENVPGVLSDRTNAFGQFIAGLSELGYGCAWRVLDAQYFGVAQRRRRVFVVGCLGDWRAAAAVLFEPNCLSGYPAPSREKREGVAGYAQSSIGGYRKDEVGGTIRANGGDIGGGSETFVAPVIFEPRSPDPNQITSKLNRSIPTPGISHTLPATQNSPIAYSIQGNTIDRADTAGANGKGVKEEQAFTLNTIDRQDVAHTFKIRSGCDGGGKGYLGQDEAAFTLDTTQSQNLMHQTAIRRLTPIECERLQGFPDGYTQIPYRGKPADQCPDGPRYKALGNSMAVPVLKWIGERIDQYDPSLSNSH
jgi:DNA (cytosine-5)-methyltransferase 1